LTRVDGSWAAEADARYEGFNGMFGGWTAALALAAVSHDADDGHVPAILTVNYVAPIPAGGEVRITTRRLGGGRAVSHWCADLHGSDDVGPLATATVVLTGRRPTDGHVQVAMPEAPAPETLAEWHPPMAVGSLIDVRPVRGFPPFGRVDTTSLDWVRETSGRPVDRVQLALLADACAPRPFFWSEGPRPSATLAMTVYFHATDDELTAVGDDYVLNEVTGVRGNASIADQSLRMWSRQGVLLTSSHQLCSYR
jgi:acyl-CoA thioesterase